MELKESKVARDWSWRSRCWKVACARLVSWTPHCHKRSVRIHASTWWLPPYNHTIFTYISHHISRPSSRSSCADPCTQANVHIMHGTESRLHGSRLGNSLLYTHPQLSSSMADSATSSGAGMCSGRTPSFCIDQPRISQGRGFNTHNEVPHNVTQADNANQATGLRVVGASDDD